jgi:hypothetical protein
LSYPLEEIAQASPDFWNPKPAAPAAKPKANAGAAAKPESKP